MIKTKRGNQLIASFRGFEKKLFTYAQGFNNSPVAFDLAIL